ncbi:MAG TPA: 50S ribosomal protein L17 [Persephonella sp.]|uniref:Large ribosomal subunit protein bL17 n=1 Tax=Persephonella marina (strain DSM 14350 / EX-H1) TaxID=123214 RepID=RL17_PERMH|nr:MULTISPECIES: 50S ribosomal protein L17 [Persephonella]C0QQQ2.1 RecName: Full=Large ribosomal subunit protein bL17; AltName: Full=50S ribosomal protein L17 [Persephonella marina EX-H1]ACO04841.1 ribosomal protein L17 [Persephonella marina EX-H1]HCB68749.1 50S ribosomal protein L17 [Persephonella sp.]
MRHRVKTKSFHRPKEQREALFVNLAIALIEHGKIETTVQKAKALRPFVEKLVTLAKKETVAARRLLNARLRNNTKAATKLFKEIAPLLKERNGGYTRIYKLDKRRRGDDAQMAIIEFVEHPDKE